MSHTNYCCCDECRWRKDQEENDEAQQRAAYFREYGSLRKRIVDSWRACGKRFDKMGRALFEGPHVHSTSSRAFGDTFLVTIRGPFDEELTFTEYDLEVWDREMR